MVTIDTTTNPVAAPRKTLRRAVPVVGPVEPPRPQVRRRDSPWLRRAIVFVTCVLLADALFGDRSLAQTFRARRDYEQASSKLSSLRHENAVLRAKARQLQADPAAIEAVARQELGLIRPGEVLVVVKDLN